MKVVNKKLNKAQLTTICLLIISVVLLAGYVTVSFIAKRLTQNSVTEVTPSIELLEGESSYLNQPVAYKAIRENQILLLQVSKFDEESNQKKLFDISRYPDDQGSFMFHYYVDGKEEAVPYIPPIYGAEGDFEYESLYAVEQNDGYGRIYYLTYLCSAVGTPYFRERIELPPDDTEAGKKKRDDLLTQYGLTKGESTIVSFMYGERDSSGLIVEGSEKTHTIAIGKKALSGAGYYFMVDDRDYVYYTASDYFKYALVGFEEFIKGMLVAEGLESDSTYEPYLTTDFKTWVGTKYEEGEKIFTYSKEESKKGYENPEVVVRATLKESLDKGVDFVPDSNDFDGYQVAENERFTFNLELLKQRYDFDRIEGVFKGKEVGSYENNELILTLLKDLNNSQSKTIDFGGDYGNVSYEYSILAIESVISDSGERTEGKVTSDDDLVKITYRYALGSESVKHDCHAVISLSDLSDEDKAKIVGKDIGKLDTPVSITITYTKDVYEYCISSIDAVIDENGEEKTDGTVLSTDAKKKLRITYSCKLNGEYITTDAMATFALSEISVADKNKLVGCKVGQALGDDSVYFRNVETNALSSNEKLVITEILAIYDEHAMAADKITETSYVNVSYYRIFDGVKGSPETMIIRLCDIDDKDRLAPLKTALLGKGKGKYEYTVYDTDYYYELLRDFVTYEISSIDFFVVNEIIASFRFENPSLRDPYYGDTFFVNTLKNDYKLYGLNADSCEQVVKYFGGIGSGSSTSAVGFSGETVAVGLTIENMENYDLYAHRIYFELPRGLYDASEGTEGDSADQISDYGWFSELGFTLYISDVTYDENGKRIRYIGSDMYDLVAKVDATNLDFLEKDFVEFWARRNLLMMSIRKLEELNIDFNMKDYQGSYDFKVSFGDIQFEGSDDTMEQQLVQVTPSADAFDTKLKELMVASGESSYGLTPLYNQVQGNGNMTYYPGSYDTLGTAYFNSVYEIVQLTRYQGVLTEEEQEKAYASEAILTINIKVQGNSEYYTYKFHRLDDRRVMVSLSHNGTDGNMEVSDFYITMFAFKKIVGNYIKLLNGQSIDGVVGYPY